MWKLSGQPLLGGGGGGEEEVGSILEGESEEFCSLSPMQRIYAFAAILLAGFVCMFLFYSPLAIFWLLEAFLIGAVQQLRMMFDPTRIIATSIYLGCVVLALVCALLIHSKILTIIAIICEICALIWYSLSYIPFARRMVSQLMIQLCDTEL